MALYVGGGVLLGVPQLLGQAQGLPKGRSLSEHPGQDEVGGAVKDACNLGDMVGGERFAKGLEDRDPPAYAGLKEEMDPLLLRQGQKDVPLFRHQLFVGGDDALPLADALRKPGEGGLHPAHGLQDHGNLRVLQDGVDGLDQPVLVGQAGKGAAVQDIGGFHRFPCLPFQKPAVLHQDFYYTGAHNAVAQDCDLFHSAPPFFFLWFGFAPHPGLYRMRGSASFTGC